MASPIRSSRSGSNVAPRAIATGKQVALPTTTPRGPSVKREAGDAEAVDVPGRPGVAVVAAGRHVAESGPERHVAVEQAEHLVVGQPGDERRGLGAGVGASRHAVGGRGERCRGLTHRRSLAGIRGNDG